MKLWSDDSSRWPPGSWPTSLMDRIESQEQRLYPAIGLHKNTNIYIYIYIYIILYIIESNTWPYGMVIQGLPEGLRRKSHLLTHPFLTHPLRLFGRQGSEDRGRTSSAWGGVLGPGLGLGLVRGGQLSSGELINMLHNSHM